MCDTPALPAPDQALLRLLERLEHGRYDFVTPTPLTHQRVLKRPAMQEARDLRGALGWSQPFGRDALPSWTVELLETAGLLRRDGERLKSAIRVSRVRGLLFIHSAFPTEAKDAVFLGPDSYRFADFIAAELFGRSWIGRLVDVGGGAGVGALTAAAGRTTARIVLTDINPTALRFARVNAVHAGTALETVEAPDLDGAPDGVDLIVANPPYMVDAADRAYRDGGGLHGAGVSLDWATAALPKLAAGGRFLLYTGSAIVEGGRDPLREALSALTVQAGARLSYRELDPDVFGEELEKPPYADVERIAVVGVAITKPREVALQN